MLPANFSKRHEKFRHLTYLYSKFFRSNNKSLFKMSRYYRKRKNVAYHSNHACHATVDIWLVSVELLDLSRDIRFGQPVARFFSRKYPLDFPKQYLSEANLEIPFKHNWQSYLAFVPFQHKKSLFWN